MSSNILLLPRFQPGATAVVVNNSDWRDVWFFQNARTGETLDLTGISFHGQLRTSATDPTVLLDFSTANGTLINGEAHGSLTFAIPVAQMRAIKPGTSVMDMLAVDAAAGIHVNLFETEPAVVTVLQGVTR